VTIGDASLVTPVESGELLSVPGVRRRPGALFWYRFSRNKPAILGGVIIVSMVLVALLAPILAPYNPDFQDLNHVVQPPGHGHLLGTDDLGRDMLSRIIYGSRISVAASIVPVLLAIVVGVPVGLFTGYFRGMLDDTIMRIVDATQAFPFLVLALALASALGPGFLNAMIAIGVGFTPAFVRIVRGQVLSIAAQDYIQSAKSFGTGDLRILRLHVLPNAMGPLLVQTSVAMAAAILAEAGLSFLGLGVQPPTPSWGQMLTVAQEYINSAPWLAIWPGVAIFLAVLGFNLLGDGIRDGLDPRLKPFSDS
jgi:ABC-type dipeptide/oligopeptide/nickel transport system permease subunit